MLKRHLVAAGRLSAFLLGACVVACSQAQPTRIGILKDNPGHNAGEPHYRDVRVVFQREGAGWVAFPSNCPDQRCLEGASGQGRWGVPEQNEGTVVEK